MLTFIKLRSLLEKGFVRGQSSDGEIREVLEAAVCLGVDINQLCLDGFSFKTESAAGPSSESVSAKKMLLDEECNFDLQCQVCRQKLGSFHMLEQHCCRHFMKELAEQFSGIMENMKCGLCNSVFKQVNKFIYIN